MERTGDPAMFFSGRMKELLQEAILAARDFDLRFRSHSNREL